MNKSDETDSLHPTTVDRVRATRLGVSLDWWAVIAAVILAVLVRLNWLPLVKW